MRRTDRLCPRCTSTAVARSRAGGTLGRFAAGLVGLRPYRCMDCWHLFLSSSRGADQAERGSEPEVTGATAADHST
jgi:hypothetical protein